MSVMAADLELVWARLAAGGTPKRQFVSVRIDPANHLDVHVALRALDTAPCLLFDLPDPSSVGDAEFEVGGMRFFRAAAAGGQCMVLSLEEPAHRELFATVCADVLSFAGADTAADGLKLVLARLDAWRLFLRSLAGGMSRSEIIGLIGELCVMKMIVERRPSLVATWRAPDDAVHDFENAGQALEVKTTLGAGSRVRISTLDQLDQAGLDQLCLLHVRLFETPLGERVDDLIDAISSRLETEASRRDFSNALLRRGLRPDDTAARSGLRTSLQQITAYAVTEAFPRLNRSDVPAGIVEASYAIELGPLQSFASPWSDGCATYCNRNS